MSVLIHTKETGKKVGWYVDFGGGIEIGESVEHCACREFTEETFGLLQGETNDDLTVDHREIEHGERIVNLTKTMHESWDKNTPHFVYESCGYHFFLKEMEFRNLDKINQVMKIHKKKLEWIEVDEFFRDKRKIFVRMRVKEFYNELEKLKLLYITKK